MSELNKNIELKEELLLFDPKKSVTRESCLECVTKHFSAALVLSSEILAGYDKHEYLDILARYNNLHILYGKDTDEELYNSDINEYDAFVYIGGSIFMEGGSSYNLSEKFYDFVKRCKENNKPFCYISCNYGPYQTQEYFNLSRRNFNVFYC